MINKVKSWVFEKNNILDKHLVKNMKKKRREPTDKKNFNANRNISIESKESS